jgi:peptidoglycan/LPS O-acetylase OafA/YrhL
MTNSGADTLLKREPVLDGIRGIAILLVLFHHFVLYSQLPQEVRLDNYLRILGGASWPGVDLFFVLSGFLITGILYDSKGSSRYFSTFYGRRVLRIFPLYYAVLAIAFFVHPTTAERLREGQIWYWTYTSNVDVAVNQWPQPLHLAHFWSLAVEEQFYLVWPFAVFALERRKLISLTVACFIAALALRFVLPNWLHHLSVYTLMPARMDALAAGAFLALVARGERRSGERWRWIRGFVFVGAAVVVGSMVYLRGLHPEAGLVRTLGYSFLALLFASFIAIARAADDDSILAGALSSRALTTLGKYSYALYVFHHPVMVYMRDREFDTSVLPEVMGSQILGFLAFSAVAMTASSILALLSWRFLETPFLKLKSRLPYSTPAPGREEVGEAAAVDARPQTPKG